MKTEQDEFDQLMEQLTASARSPRGRYAAPESWKLLEERIPARRKRFSLWRVAATAAASILLCLASWYTYDYVRPASMLTVSALAEVMNVTLPDGTNVTLNRYSTLHYPDRFKDDTREVSLRGEAYFEVEKDARHPFIVKAEAIDVQVLGTHFNVEAYPGDEEIRTTLLEGSVAVRSSQDKLILSPGETAVYNQMTQKLEQATTPESKNEIAWLDGSFRFDNLPLQEITRQLSHAFRTNIRILSPELKEYRIRAHFTGEESLEQIFDLLQSAGNFTYTQTNGTIIISTKQDER